MCIDGEYDVNNDNTTQQNGTEQQKKTTSTQQEKNVLMLLLELHENGKDRWHIKTIIILQRKQL